jgi:hypothetical protein
MLPGFNTYRREALELSGTLTLTIPVQMNVGALQETITVTGEAPVVDIQNGLNPTQTMTFFGARGGPTNEGRMTVNGMTVAAAFNDGGVSSYILDTVGADEVTTNVSGGLGEMEVGGPVMNIVPRAGGNAFRGSAFINTAGEWSEGNLDDELRAVGIDETPGIIKAYDGSVSYGGPIVRDRLWFYGSYRKLNTITQLEGVRWNWNRNTFDLSRWDWAEDPPSPPDGSKGDRCTSAA